MFRQIVDVKDGAAKEFIIGVLVKKRSEVVGKTVSGAGLRGIPGLYVLRVDRADGTTVDASDYLYQIQPVSSADPSASGRAPCTGAGVSLEAAACRLIAPCCASDPAPQDDTIWVASDLAGVNFLTKFPGLELVQQEQVNKVNGSILYKHLAQAAVAHKGPLVGQTVREIRFRSRFNAAVVAVNRWVVVRQATPACMRPFPIANPVGSLRLRALAA
jgi:hypothetical protein